MLVALVFAACSAADGRRIGEPRDTAPPGDRERLSAVISERWGVRAKLPRGERVVTDDDDEFEARASSNHATASAYVLRATFSRAAEGGSEIEMLDGALRDAVNRLGPGDPVVCQRTSAAVWSSQPGRTIQCRVGADELRARAVHAGARLVVGAARTAANDGERFLQSVTIFDDTRTRRASERRHLARLALERGAYEELCTYMVEDGFDRELCSGLARIAVGRPGPRAAQELLAALRRQYRLRRLEGELEGSTDGASRLLRLSSGEHVRIDGVPSDAPRSGRLSLWAQLHTRRPAGSEPSYRPWPLMDAIEALFAARGVVERGKARRVLEQASDQWWASYCTKRDDGQCEVPLETAQN